MTSRSMEDRLTNIFLGYWAASNQARREDRPADFDELRGTDAFSFMISRVAHDGQHAEGNFAIGPSVKWFYKDIIDLLHHRSTSIYMVWNEGLLPSLAGERREKKVGLTARGR